MAETAKSAAVDNYRRSQNQASGAVEPWTIRGAEAVDLPAITALDARITGQSKAIYWQDALRRYGAGPADRCFLIAESAEGGLLGFVIGEIRAWEFGAPPCGWIFAINVDPEARQGGIGSALFAAVCRRFAAAGVRSVRTMVDRRDHLILSFFRSQGMMAGPSIELDMEIPAQGEGTGER